MKKAKLIAGFLTVFVGLSLVGVIVSAEVNTGNEDVKVR